jgi:ABC-type sugar transport system permease subunit
MKSLVGQRLWKYKLLFSSAQFARAAAIVVTCLAIVVTLGVATWNTPRKTA